jgi:hypothetical protein
MGNGGRLLVSVALVAMLGAAGCTGGDDARPVAPSGPSGGTCVTSEVHTGLLPVDYRDRYGPGYPPPWIQAEALVAVLFYANRAESVMVSGGKMPDGRNTKILWLVDDLGPLRIIGTRAGSEETFTHVDQGYGPQHPSIIEVPSPGCWTLTALVEGEDQGSITIRVVGAARPNVRA